MAYTVELYDPTTTTTYDITDRTLEVIIKESLDSESSSFSVSCKDIQLNHLFNYISVYNGATLLLSGIVLDQIDADGGRSDFKLTTFEGEDWGHLLNKRIVAKTYLSTDAFAGRPDLILEDIFDEHLTEFTHANVATTSISISELIFNYITCRDAIDLIFDQLNPDYHWYIDRDKDLHFFYQYESDGSTFTENEVDSKTLRVEYTGQQHINRIWIVGRKQMESTSISDYYTGDGNKRYFQLSYEPNETSVYVDNVLKNSKLEENDDGAQDFLINKSRKLLIIPDNIVTPFSGTIKATYKPTKQFVDYFENYTDITQYGLYEGVVKNSNILDKVESRRFGRAEVKKTSETRRKVSFKSRSALSITLGQRITLDITNSIWDVSGYFLVKAVKRVITPAEEYVNFELEELI